jgi:phosphopantothenoylcysteine decarboxylase/phosphopantothenate--cysteine ligase
MNVLLIVTASISAFKACEVARSLRKAGHAIKVVMTPDALKFIGSLSFSALVGSEALTEDTFEMEHIKLAKWQDAIVVCPASAAFIGQVANCLGGNLALDLILARKQNSRVIFAPAMNPQMWINVQRNVKLLEDMKFEIIQPAYGDLACGDEGFGRLADIADICKYVNEPKNS